MIPIVSFQSIPPTLLISVLNFLQQIWRFGSSSTIVTLLILGVVFVGIAETMVTAYGSSLYKDAIVYIILILILILKPAGLLGKTLERRCKSCVKNY